MLYSTLKPALSTVKPEVHVQYKYLAYCRCGHLGWVQWLEPEDPEGRGGRGRGSPGAAQCRVQRRR